jgi:hypothetical protein
MKRKFLSFLVILLLISGLFVFQFVSTVKANNVETRYMRSDFWGGANDLKLLTSQTSSDSFLGLWSDTSDVTVYLGVKPYILYSNGKKHSLSSDAVVGIVSQHDASGYKSATWACSLWNLNSTDKIRLMVYKGTSTPPATYGNINFTTEALGGLTLDAATWNFTYYIRYLKSSLGHGVYEYDYWFEFGDSSHNSRIENFQWTTSGAAPQEVTYKFTENMKPSASLNQWQEQFYLFPESINPSATLTHGIEMLFRFFEYTFTETMKPSSVLLYWIEKTKIYMPFPFIWILTAIVLFGLTIILFMTKFKKERT